MIAPPNLPGEYPMLRRSCQTIDWATLFREWRVSSMTEPEPRRRPDEAHGRSRRPNSAAPSTCGSAAGARGPPRGSHGYWSVALCRRHAQLRSTVLELPQAIRHAAPLLAREEMGDRVVHRAGDALTDDLGTDAYDLVFLAAVTHPVSGKPICMSSWKRLLGTKNPVSQATSPRCSGTCGDSTARSPQVVASQEQSVLTDRDRPLNLVRLESQRHGPGNLGQRRHIVEFAHQSLHPQPVGNVAAA
jgi:hypothetical protein